MSRYVSFIKKKNVVIISVLCLLCILLYSFKLSKFSICVDLKECSINASALAYEHYLDSLGMFIVEGGEGNDLDYLFYDGFHVYCPLSDTSNHLKDTGRVWDGKYMVDDFAFFKADLTDDIQLFRIRKFFNLFYLVEKDHLLPDITLWFFTNYGCKQSFVN